MNVAELLDRIQEVCPLPAAAQRVAQLAADPKARIEQIASVLATDPALAAEVLRIANSAAFGRPRQVADLEQAIGLIGLREIQNMASAMAMLAAFHTKHELGFDFHDRAVFAGSLARSLSGRVGVLDKSEAFLCGLLSEIGAMACAAVDSEAYLHLWHQVRADPDAREGLEQARYGTTSRAIGAQLLRRNGLPEAVAVAIEAGPNTIGEAPLPRLTAFARQASLVLMDVAAGADPAKFSEQIGHLREALAFPVSAEELVEACVASAGTVLSALQTSR